MKMIHCKACGKEIAANAKSCPSCGAKNKKPIYKRVWFWCVLVLILMAIGSSVGENKTPSDPSASSVGESKTPSDPSASVGSTINEDKDVKVEYTAYSVDEMMDDLDDNPLNASEKYLKKDVEITGKLSTIDSSGNYISVLPEHDEWAVIGVHCSIKTDEQLDKLKKMSIGDKITVNGKITDVGEVLGYYLDIDSIK